MRGNSGTGSHMMVGNGPYGTPPLGSSPFPTPLSAAASMQSFEDEETLLLDPQVPHFPFCWAIMQS